MALTKKSKSEEILNFFLLPVSTEKPQLEVFTCYLVKGIKYCSDTFSTFTMFENSILNIHLLTNTLERKTTEIDAFVFVKLCRQTCWPLCATVLDHIFLLPQLLLLWKAISRTDFAFFVSILTASSNLATCFFQGSYYLHTFEVFAILFSYIWIIFPIVVANVWQICHTQNLFKLFPNQCERFTIWHISRVV